MTALFMAIAVFIAMFPAVIAFDWQGTPRGDLAVGAWLWGMCGWIPAALAAIVALEAGLSSRWIYFFAIAVWAGPAWAFVLLAYWKHGDNQ